MIQPETRFANVGNDRVAYQVLGSGPRDLLITSGFWSNLDVQWEDPGIARFMRRVASFCRLIRFDRRGTGQSDHPSDTGVSELEHWLTDCAAVLDAVDSKQIVLLGTTTGEVGSLILEFYVRHPERCDGLIFVNTTSCWTQRPDYPEGLATETMQQIKDLFLRAWGKPEFAALMAPSHAKNEAFMNWYAKLQRSMASPRAAMENIDFVAQLDSRPLLSHVQVPVLAMARTGYRFVPPAQVAYIARHIPGAGFVELPGTDGSLTWESPEQILDLIEEFMTGRRHGDEVERAVATVLLADIVDSTRRAAEMGNAAWRQLLDVHDKVVREQVAVYRGRFIESAGDGTLSTFDNPGRAIDCAFALQHALKPLGLQIRAGLHTGEVELRDDGRVGGIAVHVGARIQALADADEVLASHTVQSILMGSRYQFQERGKRELKGVPGKWGIYAVGAHKP